MCAVERFLVQLATLCLTCMRLFIQQCKCEMGTSMGIVGFLVRVMLWIKLFVSRL